MNERTYEVSGRFGTEKFTDELDARDSWSLEREEVDECKATSASFTIIDNGKPVAAWEYTRNGSVRTL